MTRRVLDDISPRRRASLSRAARCSRAPGTRRCK